MLADKLLSAYMRDGIKHTSQRLHALQTTDLHATQTVINPGPAQSLNVDKRMPFSTVHSPQMLAKQNVRSTISANCHKLFATELAN